MSARSVCSRVSARSAAGGPDPTRAVADPAHLGRHRDRARLNVLYDKAARGPVEHWNLPGARHTDAIQDRPADYQRRVVAFFDEALR
jgi:hypothetical protein